MRVQPPDRDRLLAAVAAAQLAMGVAGLTIALKRQHGYEFLVWHGRTATIGRDAIWIGTALSPPMPMLALQSVAIAGAWRGERRAARGVLGGLGAAMVVGYLGESLVRRRLFRRSERDRLESAVARAGLTLAAAMAVLGGRGALGKSGR